MPPPAPAGRPGDERQAFSSSFSMRARQHVATAPREAPVHETELDEEAIKALRSLGYLR